MVHYTQQDYEKLLEILYRDSDELSRKTKYSVFFTINREAVNIKLSDLFTVLFSRKLPYSNSNLVFVTFKKVNKYRTWNNTKSELTSRSLTNALVKFLRRIPLIKVPLYLQSFPELSLWRLKIGK